ncbi:hypothetical protein [Asanoa iriomotensis]|uniref:GatB/YqeY domain-containing protein n=1 Tax=Asanoa iriomotensis TaxID=234613 RepID=A0ABQ4BTY4_9ACTN|nr:hypothetical protein [Asanoa iriomotensis]GIF53985.1 hypothetical protein Air01nite_00800 [Asanoa iriomotensis]
MPPTEPSPLRERLRRTLRDALRSRDAVAAGALRAAISAIDNAEAVPVTAPDRYGSDPMGAAGLGAAEAPRRTLDGEEIQRIVRAEAADRMAAAAQFERLGQVDAAARMRAGAELLTAITDAS